MLTVAVELTAPARAAGSHADRVLFLADGRVRDELTDPGADAEASC
ncbi:hypothetical protein [Actinacidiphila bryophytorum]|uniref:Uncharacterized protein n=1 Tax=Actinacidiphila bryophytorum TaxID=1436133 RepID=A0A9W4H280_9ACTN|nr:hypothetical protein [Actinacidiphila bryophytorum]CAG7644206.1 hypothetical protein SBRY_30999 [Actinacidiphila bryophytorum]